MTESTEEPHFDKGDDERLSAQDTDSSSDDFCESCVELGFYFLTEKIGFIKQRAAEGCVTCFLLEKVIESYFPSAKDEKLFTIHKAGWVLEITPVDENSEPKNEMQINLYGLTVTGSPGSDYLSPFDTEGRYDVLEQEKGFSPIHFKYLWPIPASQFPAISRDTASQEALSLAKEYLSECMSKHETCPPATHRVLPTRVLDLQNTTNTKDIRQYESKGENAVYFALSHCWGGAHVVRLKLSNKVHFKDHIPWEGLPRTFQNAVSFTRSFGVRNLWVDSLCIIQDCDEDWRAEANRMADVYRNSILTIAAAKGDNAHAGLFTAVRSDFDLRHISSVTEMGQLADVYFRRKIPQFEVRHGFPLLSRG